VSYLLDTNVLSELRKGPQADPNVRAWDESNQDNSRFISVVVVAELRKGAHARARKDAQAGVALHRWINRVVLNFKDRILPVDLQVAELWATLMVPDPRSPMDALIAATALAHSLTLVTRNVRDVTGCDVAVLDPWTYGS
jgi:predicted nucleic acid-binding protein